MLISLSTVLSWDRKLSYFGLNSPSSYINFQFLLQYELGGHCTYLSRKRECRYCYYNYWDFPQDLRSCLFSARLFLSFHIFSGPGVTRCEYCCLFHSYYGMWRDRHFQPNREYLGSYVRGDNSCLECQQRLGIVVLTTYRWMSVQSFHRRMFSPVMWDGSERCIEALQFREKM